MGKANFQIATWQDLASIGYRIPYGAASELLKGVTYKDLTYCSQGYLPEHSAKYWSLSSDVRRSYQTLNASKVAPGTSVDITYQDIKNYSEDSSKQFTFRVTATDTQSAIQRIKWGSFTIHDATSEMNVEWYNMNLFITTIGSEANFMGNLEITHNLTGQVVGSGLISFSVSGSDAKKAISVVLPTTLANLASGTYDIILALRLIRKAESVLPGVGTPGLGGTPSIGITPMLFTTIQFFGSPFPSLLLPEEDICIRWEDVKASSKQSVSSSAVSVPVYCGISETLSNSATYANEITFEYCYYTADAPNTLKTLQTGYISLGSGGKVTTEAWGTCYVTINPQVVGTVSSDFLRITCGTCGGNQTWSWSYQINGIWQDERSFPNTAVTATGTLANSYAESMQSLTGVHFKID